MPWLKSDVEKTVIGIAVKMSSKQSVTLDSYVYRDLGLEGWDAIDFYTEIDNEFGVDTKKITQRISRKRKPLFIGREKTQFEPVDVNLRTISELILEAR
ncbi:MAG: hypothetical protein E7773_01280 [Sphingomonas sp.]|uniref:hypothetical protein n=1 Tax=Sphingomonas sp. TaxID=28214 RepID=UPI001218C9D0|nr:hypothetical protein [Sphingomonas sp.]THD38405.1 MAG: hypothetical protein E7773_01280 [Sphingomonas sp.]